MKKYILLYGGIAFLTAGALIPASHATVTFSSSTRVVQETPTVNEPTISPTETPTTAAPVVEPTPEPTIPPTIVKPIVAAPPRVIGTPSPASAPRTSSPCPVASWAYREWTANHTTTTYNSDFISPLGTIPSGSHLSACIRPDNGYGATAFGYVRPQDIGPSTASSARTA